MAAAVARRSPRHADAAASQLTAAQVQSVVAYLRTLPSASARSRPRRRRYGRGQRAASRPAAASKVAARCSSSRSTAARNGRWTDAGDRAFDAYLAFEPIETPARARDPGVVASMERLFTDFKASVKAQRHRRAPSARATRSSEHAEGGRADAAAGQRHRKRSCRVSSSFCAKASRRFSSSAPSSRSCSRPDIASGCESIWSGIALGARSRAG